MWHACSGAIPVRTSSATTWSLCDVISIFTMMIQVEIGDLRCTLVENCKVPLRLSQLVVQLDQIHGQSIGRRSRSHVFNSHGNARINQRVSHSGMLFELFLYVNFSFWIRDWLIDWVTASESGLRWAMKGRSQLQPRLWWTALYSTSCSPMFQIRGWLVYGFLVIVTAAWAKRLVLPQVWTQATCSEPTGIRATQILP
jgi:hypothetical protein